MPLHTYNTVLKKDGSEIANNVRINWPELSKEGTDTTVLKSTNMWKEAIRGWKDAGEISFECHHSSAQFNTFLTSFNEGPTDALDTWLIEFPLDAGEATAANLSIPGFISKLSEPEAVAGEDGIYRCMVTVKLSGEPTFTVAT